MSANQHIRNAISMLGSEAKLAAACGYSQAAISKVEKSGRVSAEMAVAIEQATSGAVPRFRLRPDLWDSSEQPSPQRRTS